MEGILQVIIGLIIVVLGGGSAFMLWRQRRGEQDRGEHDEAARKLDEERRKIHEHAQAELDLAREAAEELEGQSLADAFKERLRRRRGRS